MGVVLHVGHFKTGTSSIQRWMRDHPDVLAEHDARFPRGWLRLNCHLELHMAFMRPDRDSSARSQGNEWLNPKWRQCLADQVAADLAAHPDEVTVLSAEHTGLLRYDDEVEPLRALVGDARVVVYEREPNGFLASMRDQLEKNGVHPATDRNDYAYVEADSWLVRFDERAELWERYFTDVERVDYDKACAGDGSVIPGFLSLLGIDDAPDVDDYWLNRRGETDQRVAGNRFSCGLPFGMEP
jgi:hypothetical protein